MASSVLALVVSDVGVVFVDCLETESSVFAVTVRGGNSGGEEDEEDAFLDRVGNSEEEAASGAKGVDEAATDDADIGGNIDVEACDDGFGKIGGLFVVFFGVSH